VTDVGVISLGDGIDTGAVGEMNDLTLLDEVHARQIRAEYAQILQVVGVEQLVLK
jgi:hypothetical protein